MRLASIWAIWVFLDISHDFPTIFFVIFFVISQLEIFFTWILFPLTCSCMLVSNLVGFYQVGRDVCCSLHLTHMRRCCTLVNLKMLSMGQMLWG